MTLSLDNLENANDVRMGDFLENAQFSRQELGHISPVQFAFVNDLDGDLNNLKNKNNINTFKANFCSQYLNRMVNIFSPFFVQKATKQP